MALQNSVIFDKATGKFIVSVTLTPDQYGRCAQEGSIPDIDTVVFDKTNAKFNVPVYMSPDEYSKYMQDDCLPAR